MNTKFVDYSGLKKSLPDYQFTNCVCKENQQAAQLAHVYSMSAFQRGSAMFLASILANEQTDEFSVRGGHNN